MLLNRDSTNVTIVRAEKSGKLTPPCHRRRFVINIGGNKNLGNGVNPGGLGSRALELCADVIVSAVIGGAALVAKMSFSKIPENFLTFCFILKIF